MPSETQPGYTVADPWCDTSGRPFTALPGATAHAGVKDGAAYRIEVPARWNGELVLYAHGYRGTGTTVYVDDSPIRAHLIARGYAWAASSYETNGYDVGQGVEDSHELIALARQVTGKPARRVYMTGFSMGGHVTAVAVERYRRTFAGAMPACGVLGDTALYDYFTDANVTAAALTGTPTDFPLAPAPDYGQVYADRVLGLLPELGTGFNQGSAPTLTKLGRTWSDAVERRSGGDRPGFDSAFAFWNATGRAPLTQIPFLFGLYPGLTGGTASIADGNVVDNRRTVYQLDDRPGLSRAERELNRDVLRVAPTDRPSRGLDGIPAVEGDPRIPVLSLHNIGDLFVPYSMEQIYADRAARHRQSGNFVSRAIRAVGHCDFTPGELTRAFDDLVTWVEQGRRAAGDQVHHTSRPDFGCRFTEVARPTFAAPACR
ncbi:alpha/beta hydrolase [Microtetraspora sp. NBRC 13810]|nr:alpha/beta hydrolase [Microtetraspora sp. NBRC 13810]